MHSRCSLSVRTFVRTDQAHEIYHIGVDFDFDYITFHMNTCTAWHEFDTNLFMLGEEVKDFPYF